MNCCDGCIKYSLFFSNLVFSLSGVALIIVGSVFLSNTSNFSELLEDLGLEMKLPQIMLIFIGIIIFFIATLGCCGAIRESRCLLITYAVCLLSVFIVQLAIGIYALTNKSDFSRQVEEGLSKEFDKITKDPTAKRIFEGVERNMECCGVKGFSDYITRLIPVPGSCCEDKSNCRIKPLAYWKTGCASLLTDFTGMVGEVLGGLAIGFSFIEILGAIFAIRMAIKVK